MLSPTTWIIYSKVSTGTAVISKFLGRNIQGRTWYAVQFVPVFLNLSKRYHYPWYQKPALLSFFLRRLFCWLVIQSWLALNLEESPASSRVLEPSWLSFSAPNSVRFATRISLNLVSYHGSHALSPRWRQILNLPNYQQCSSHQRNGA